MDTSPLLTLSDQIANVVSSVAASVVQVHGRRRPASGIAYGDDVVLTTGRALGREEGLRVTGGDGRIAEAELAGWDPATGLAVLRTPGLGAPPVSIANEPARVGQIAIAVARSWSNALTALAISDQTVKVHVASIYGKLQVANRTDAVRRAVRRGLVSL